MAELAKKHTDRLQELKDTVEEAQEYFQENAQRYNEFMRFVFKSSLTDNEAATLADTGKPTIEFGILEAYISRLRGEFAKQQPSLEVRAADGVPAAANQVDGGDRCGDEGGAEGDEEGDEAAEEHRGD